MKPFDPNAKTLCMICGHTKDVHMQVCGDRDCDCLCFLPEGTIEKSPINDWQESALMAILDLIMEEKEGDVFVPTKHGTECRVRVRFVPEIGITMVNGGRA